MTRLGLGVPSGLGCRGDGVGLRGGTPVGVSGGVRWNGNTENLSAHLLWQISPSIGHSHTLQKLSNWHYCIEHLSKVISSNSPCFSV